MTERRPTNVSAPGTVRWPWQRLGTHKPRPVPAHPGAAGAGSNGAGADGMLQKSLTAAVAKVRRMADDQELPLTRRQEWEAAKRALRLVLKQLDSPKQGRPHAVDRRLEEQIRSQDRWLKALADAARAQQGFVTFKDSPRTPLMLRCLIEQHDNYARAWDGLSRPAQRRAASTRKEFDETVRKWTKEVARKYGKVGELGQVRQIAVQPGPYVPPLPPDFAFAGDVDAGWARLVACGPPATWTDIGHLRAFYLYCRVVAGLSYAVDEQTLHVLDYTEYADFAGEIALLGVDEEHAYRCYRQACARHAGSGGWA
ncbi:hypothetical protein LG634_07300 [Streptomyces bambusae]|uniref:hypothetical protein n=1 Tax=Streptomyces bambusae TaxID=1550616 RepID=UPI001CFEDC80|nr:hypothetical protein [Streptomyces bambusae]MCB5164638.1 hypothetical protein [Streptomyces bambusae]